MDFDLDFSADIVSTEEDLDEPELEEEFERAREASTAGGPVVGPVRSVGTVRRVGPVGTVGTVGTVRPVGPVRPVGIFIDAPVPRMTDDDLQNMLQARKKRESKNKNGNKNGNKNEDKCEDKNGDKSTKPHIDTTTPAFGTRMEDMIHSLISPDRYTDLENFLYDCKASETKTLLEAVANPSDLAWALHRLRTIIGIAEYDPKTEYGLYYVLSYSTHAGLTDDTENYICQTMSSLVSELFLSPTYLLDCDAIIAIIVLPTDLTPFEMDWIQNHSILGLDTPDSLIESLALFQEYLTQERIPGLGLSPEGPEKQWELMKTWMSSIAPRLPRFDEAKWHIHDLPKKDFEKLLQWLGESIHKEFETPITTRIKEEETLLRENPSINRSGGPIIIIPSK